MILKRLTTRKNNKCGGIFQIGKYIIEIGIEKGLHTGIEKNSVSGWISLFGYFIGYYRQ